MRFSIWPDNNQSWQQLSDLVKYCDATGWDAAYFADHFMPNGSKEPVGGPVLECWTVLAALAATTVNLDIGSLVTSITYRHPAVITKAACTLDQVTDGRFILGVGAGWQENEHTAYGINFPGPGRRLDQLEEACAVIRSLLSVQRTTFDGTYYRFKKATCDPKPAQGKLPLLIGGTGEHRTLPIAAKFADIWNGWCTPDEFRRKSGILDRYCESFGRDPASLSKSTQVHLLMSDDARWLKGKRQEPARRPRLIGSPGEVIDQIGIYAQAGLDELIISDRTLGSANQRTEVCQMFISTVAPAFR